METVIWSGHIGYVVLFFCDSAESKDKFLVDISMVYFLKKLVQVSASDIEGRGVHLRFVDNDRKPCNTCYC